MVEKPRTPDEEPPRQTSGIGAESAPAPDATLGETISLGASPAAGGGIVETEGNRARAAEEALRAAERRFKSTVERVADGILVVDQQGKIRFTNPAGARIFGRPADELLESELGIPLVSGETTQVDLNTPVGTRVAELRIADTVWDEKDALLLSVRDVTDRREAEERERTLLREQLARMQAEEAAERARVLADASRILAASTDQDTIICELARLLAARVADHCLIDVSADPGSGRYRKVVAARSRDGSVDIVVRAESSTPAPAPLSTLGRRLYESRATERVHGPGTRWMRDASRGPEDEEVWRALAPAAVVVASLATSAGPLGILAVAASAPPGALDERDERLVADLAHRTSLALENARLLRFAEEASRAKSDFLAIISHELRTPLTGITGYASLLREEVERPLTEREGRYVDGVLRCADRLLAVIDQILLFARSSSGRDEIHYGRMSLAELVGGVADVVRPLALEAGLELILRPPERRLQVTTDAAMVRHILLHLLTNAIKFTERGSVTLEADVRADDVLLRVSDTGRGIPSEKLGRIFEPFSQAEAPYTRSVGGVGIGLNLVETLVRRLGGELDVDSEPGLGSTFTVRLPLEARGEADPGALDGRSGRVSGTGSAGSPPKKRS
jgi:signal transduction histidine kinase